MRRDSEPEGGRKAGRWAESGAGFEAGMLAGGVRLRLSVEAGGGDGRGVIHNLGAGNSGGEVTGRGGCSTYT